MHTLTNRTYRSFERIAATYQPYLARIAALLAVTCALAAFLYGIFLLEAVGQAAARTSAERQIRDIASTLSTLEGQYLAATKELTPERAKSMGYVTPAKVSSVVVSSAAPLSFVGR